MNQPQPQRINVNLKDATKQVCGCGCEKFVIEISIFTISAIMSPTGKIQPVEVPKLVCKGCGLQYVPGGIVSDKGGD